MIKFKNLAKICLSAAVGSVLMLSSFGASALTSTKQFDIKDVTIVQRIIAGIVEYKDEYLELYDVCKDGKITVTDATEIQRIISGAKSTTAEKTVSLDKTSLVLGTGEKYKLTVTSDIPNVKVTFSTDNNSVATVSDDGEISAVSSGTATIKCTTANGLTAFCNVTVKPMATSLSLNASSITLGVGEQYDLDSFVNSGAAAYHREYSSSDSSKASVEASGGLVTAKAVGTATVTCKLTNGVTATCKVTVKPMATTVSLNKSSITLGVGEQYDLDSFVNSGVAAFHRVYSSSDSSKASVEASGGLVTAKAEGTANIVCKLSNGLQASCNVTVKPMAKSLSLNKSSITLKVGEKFDLDSFVGDGTAAYYRTYSSSDSSVAPVQASGGLVKAMKLGKATIYCKLKNGVTASCEVTVSGSKVKCIDISTWQGSNVDFNKVKSDGIEYVILRAGYGKEKSQKDNTFEINYKKAKAAGLKVGAYWFSYAMTPNEAFTEAQACLYCLNGKQLDMPLYYDMEYLPAMNSLSSSQYTQMAINFCDSIKKGGYRTGIYSSASVYSHILRLNTLRNKGYSIWNAEWNSYYTVNCDIWQYSEKGSVSGISTNVDMNYIYNLNIVQ